MRTTTLFLVPLQVSAGPAKVRPIASAHGGRPAYGVVLRVAL